jgi:hypothetical protein
MTFGKMLLLQITMTIYQLIKVENRHSTLIFGHASAHKQLFKTKKCLHQMVILAF